MSDFSDELLMAYADGELKGNELARVEAFVRATPEAAARIAVFATTGRELADIFDKTMREPVPQQLIEAIYASEPGVHSGARAVADNVIPFARRQVSRPAVAGQSWALAAACVTAIAVGAGSYWSLKQASSAGETFATAQSSTGERVASVELASVLETAIGGTAVDKAIDGTAATIKPVFTFATASNGFCRQYEIKRTAADPIGGVACRDAKGAWRVESHVAFEQAATTNGDFKPAGKDGVAAVEATVDKLIKGTVFGPDEETLVLKNGWSSAAP